VSSENTQFREKVRAIAQSYKILADANRNFAFAASGIEGFRNLIEQRNMVVEDLEVLGAGLLAEIEQKFPDNSASCSNLAEMVLTLSTLLPELAEDCDLVKTALVELVESDKLVDNSVSGFRDEIRAEIARIRQGARGLRGYRQAETFGSCFINKIK
jgi:hypothetical protein